MSDYVSSTSHDLPKIGLIPKQVREFLITTNISTTTVPTGLPQDAGHCYSSWVSQLHMTIDCFPYWQF